MINPVFIRSRLNDFCFIFIIGNFLASIYALFYSIYNATINGYPFGVASFDLYFKELHHHTYFSLNALIAIIFVIHLFFDHGIKLRKRIFLLFAWFGLNLAVYVATSRVGIFLTLMVDIIFIWKLFGLFKFRWLKYAAILGFIIVFVFSIGRNNKLHYLKSKDNNLLVRIITKNKTNQRQIIWEKALQLMWQRFPFGYGTGTFKSVMSEELKTEIEEGRIKFPNPDAHNQYLEITFENGLIGLTALLMLLIFPFWTGLRKRNLILILYMAVFAVVFIFESILKRQWGVETFIITYSLLVIYLSDYEEDDKKSAGISAVLNNEIIKS